jgi:hypothetical protein
MKRTTLAVLMLALALVAVAAPLAYAQAPTPKVTINGLIDNLTSYSRNEGVYSGLLNVPGDRQWYGRTRGRFDFIGEIGKAKGVLGIELDHTYGQTGSNGSSISNAGTPSGTTASAQAFGTDAGFGLNTDQRGVIEIKWLYVEFPLPLIPIPTTARLGGQPFGAASTYKLCTYTCSDFSGVNLTSQVTPNIKTYLTYVNVREALTGPQTVNGKPGPLGPGGQGTNVVIVGGVPVQGNGASSNVQNAGDQEAAIISVEVSPFKGLDLKPMFSWFYAGGITDGNARQSRGGIVANGSATASGLPAGASAFRNPDGTLHGGLNEDRYTVGLDTRFRVGPFSLDPTVLYQFGNRGVFSQSAPGTGANTVGGALAQSGAQPASKYHGRLDAWLIDIREGFQLGPLLLEGLQVYSTGNSARNNQLGRVASFQPLTTDTGYLADWGTQLTSLGIDYLNALNEGGGRVAYPGVSVGWDKYGRAQLGLKATYAITPALSVMAGVNWHWTAEGVQKGCLATAGAGCLPIYNANTASTFGLKASQATKRENFLGTEFMSVVTWRFADGLTWDNGVGYMIMGPAMDMLTDPSVGPRNTKDAFMGTSRVRLTF